MKVWIAGCRVVFSYFFFVCLAVLLLFDRSGLAAAGLVAAALHESCHLCTMYFFDCLPEEIRFNAFGIDMIRTDAPDRSYLRDTVISLAGPAANFLAAGLFSVLHGSTAHHLMLANVSLFLFNILPIEPLDGGQALYALICTRAGPDTASKAVGITSFATLVPLSVAGFLIIFRSPGNYTLLAVCIYLMVLLVFKKGKYF